MGLALCTHIGLGISVGPLLGGWLGAMSWRGPFLGGELSEIYNPNLPFFVGAGFVLISVLFIWFNKKHLKHVDHAESGH